MPSMRRTSRSARSMSAPAGLGAELRWAACPSGPARPPMFFICEICARKSFRSKPPPLLTLSASFCAASTSTPFCTCSTSATMSPMPSTRPAWRSASKTSRPSIFSDDAGELDRRAGDLAHRQRRAAARVAVELGQHHAGQRQRVLEGLGGVDRVLALHRIDDEQRLDRLQHRVQVADLGHQRLVDAPGGRRCRPAARRSSGAWRGRARPRAMSRRLLLAAWTRTTRRRPAASRVFSCSMAAGR